MLTLLRLVPVFIQVTIWNTDSIEYKSTIALCESRATKLNPLLGAWVELTRNWSVMCNSERLVMQTFESLSDLINEPATNIQGVSEKGLNVILWLLSFLSIHRRSKGHFTKTWMENTEVEISCQILRTVEVPVIS